MIRITDQYFWNVVFGLFFIGLVTMGVIILQTEAHIPYEDISAFDIVLISLASMRLMRLFMYDSVTKFFREQFYDAKVTKAGKVTLYRPTRGPRRTITDLMSCPWCFGVWTSATILFFYLLTPLAYFPTLLLAVAAITTILQKFVAYIDPKVE